MRQEFEKRGVKMIGLSANDLSSHGKWIEDINELSKTEVQFPIIADAERKVVSTRYNDWWQTSIGGVQGLVLLCVAA